MSVFGVLQLMQISLNFKTSCCNSKMTSLREKHEWLFYYFSLEMIYDIVKSKHLCFNENEMDSKIEIPTPYFWREKSCASAFARITNSK